MNRRMFAASAIPAIVASVPAPFTAAGSSDKKSIYFQWTGYHWVQVTDGVVSHVHNGDQWFALECVDVNVAEYRQNAS